MITIRGDVGSLSVRMMARSISRRWFAGTQRSWLAFVAKVAGDLIRFNRSTIVVELDELFTRAAPNGFLDDGLDRGRLIEVDLHVVLDSAFDDLRFRSRFRIFDTVAVVFVLLVLSFDHQQDS